MTGGVPELSRDPKSAMMAASSRKRAQNGSARGQSKQQEHSGAKGSKSPSLSSPSSPDAPSSVCPQRGLLWTIGRLLTIFIKGFAALVLFAIIFNLAVVILNKTVFDGKLQQYIPTKSWKDILGQ